MISGTELNTLEPIIQGPIETDTPLHPGEQRLFEHSIFPVTTDDDIIIGISVVVQEVTELEHLRRIKVAASNLRITNRLTSRELDVIELAAERLQDKEIAGRLSISYETVKGHLKSIYKKLGVHNRKQAVEIIESVGILNHLI